MVEILGYTENILKKEVRMNILNWVKGKKDDKRIKPVRSGRRIKPPKESPPRKGNKGDNRK